MTDPVIPSYAELLWPTLKAVRALGGSGTIDEIDSKVLELEAFSNAQLAVLHGDGPGTEIQYRLAWARSYLKGMGALDNSTRGVWTVTDASRSLDGSTVRRRHAEYLKQIRAVRRAKRRQERVEERRGDPDAGPTDGSREWRDELLDELLAMSPDAFERLAQRLLREAGFISATVLGRSGDGGIDGLGVYRLSLLSFPVFFQCKRYRGSVGASAVRDFRGAMAGRGDKGLLITTGTFTPDAKAEATRDGAPPIDLIDGERLCDLLKEHGMGVRTQLRTVEAVSVMREFFESV
jgi:restriction system protein